MPDLNRITGLDSTSLAPLAVEIKDTVYGFQELGDDEAYLRIEGALALISSMVTIPDDAGLDMVSGASDFVTRWKPILAPFQITPYFNVGNIAAYITPLEPANPGAATAAEQLDGVNFIRNVLPSLVASGDSHGEVSSRVTSYLYFALGRGFLDLLMPDRPGRYV